MVQAMRPMASPSLRFLFLFVCVVNFAKATEEASTATHDHEDVEAILRELQTQAEPAPDMVTTSEASDGKTQIKGAFTVSLSIDPSVILNNATIKANFEDGVKTEIAKGAQVSKNACTVAASQGSRRLESAEPRQLAGTIKIEYTIATSADNSQAVLTNVQTFMKADTLRSLTQQVIRGIDSALCAQCANVTVTQAAVATEPAVVTPSNTDTSSADRSHVLCAIFSFAATWVL